ncbi:hypothetical protein LTR35_005304 [Friedmanniomyces endolithicus]|nr:hypothetical protein LTR35_005304 [Friedmanniomyces endolithicus]KAK0299494.1 hypothetical protein LTS00_001937 [Friedmanniomyces endolithicus]KAK1019177.1 hypothetical protein LTR54_000992 [Friedmanniomyces endolithicus]
MNIITILRSGYLAASALVLLVAFISPFRTRFLAYGARTSPSNGPSSAKKDKAAVKNPQSESTLIAVLDRLADLTVPHSWFTSFYVVCVAWSLVWASQLLIQGPLSRLVAAYATAERGATMTARQVVVAWAMLMVQGSRRLYESLEFAKPSKSRMWFVHWVLGIGFYTATGMAVWVEGISAVQAHTFSLDDIAVTGPDLRTFASVLLFILASGVQHDCHAYLASLKSKPAPSPPTNTVQISERRRDESNESGGYKLPDHPAFAYLIAPHYTAECLIYLSLTMVAAPQGGAWVNLTLACALVFVVVNLGATADVTREWYRGRFGEEAVKGKWRLVPFVW